MTIKKEEIQEKVLTFFCQSRDWNGLPFTTLCEEYCTDCLDELDEGVTDVNRLSTEQLIQFVNPCNGTSKASLELRQILAELVRAGDVTVVLDDNPHIKRLPNRSIAKQLDALERDHGVVCLYPNGKLVESKIQLSDYDGTPYKRRLWQVEPQLTPVYFDLDVLEGYADDPRYIFRFDDISGAIHLSDEHYESEEMRARDRTYLEHFGLGYRKRDGLRVASVPLCYLARLTPEHQQRWKTFEIDEPCIMDFDYHDSSICGKWPTSVSIYFAFIEEMAVINEMCVAAGYPELFRQTFKSDRPKYFRFPFRNTKEAYYRSVYEMDKMVSQNINQRFFDEVLRPEETFEERSHHKSGQSSIHDLGTLKLLNRWLLSRFQFRRDSEREKAVADLKALDDLRRERQVPAHKIEPDAHGRTFSDRHDDLLFRVYKGLRAIRLILANHPGCEEVDVPEWLMDGKIRRFSWKGEDS